MSIPFNKPCLIGNELSYIQNAISSGKISGDGLYTKKCTGFFKDHFGFQNNLLTTSCTDAIEMASILLDIKPGDEVIAPSYTFVSTVNPFVLRGAKIVFADSGADNPNIDLSLVENLITEKTKGIILVHYAGIACDIEAAQKICKKHNLFLFEDAAQAIDSYYKGKPLGTFGELSAFSFHETKNIISGEGGLLVVNDSSLYPRAEIIREKGTNRSAFFRGEVDKYNWVDIGSSFLPSDLIAAYLFAQLENIEKIQTRRKSLWERYNQELSYLANSAKLSLPFLPEYATSNAHMFYVVCGNIDERTNLINRLKENGINAVFHYLSLHKSQFYQSKHDGRNLPYSDKYSDQLLRLPLYYDMTDEEQKIVIDTIKAFYE
jgi:dTDP-4-amino-4,6-dideoxygalactose transaminase